MKKLVALVLSLMLVLSCAAFAEETPDMTAVTPTYEGAWMPMEYGTTAYLPADWLVLELTEEQTAAGIFAAFASADGANTLQIGWAALEEEVAIEDLQAKFAETYPDAEIAETTSGSMIGYTDTENNAIVCVTMDTVDLGIYILTFTPGDDAEFAMMAAQIASTFGYAEEAPAEEAVEEEAAEEETEE